MMKQILNSFHLVTSGEKETKFPLKIMKLQLDKLKAKRHFYLRI